MGRPAGMESVQASDKGDEVIVMLDIDPDDFAILPYKMRLNKFLLGGAAMSVGALKSAMQDIEGAFESEMRSGLTREHFKKQPNLIIMLKKALYYALFKAISTNSRIPPELKKEVFFKGKKNGVAKSRQDLQEKSKSPDGSGAGVAGGAVRYSDPLLSDPLVPFANERAKNAPPTEDFTQLVDEYYLRIFEGERTGIGMNKLTPGQRLVLAIIYENYFKPILDNLKVLNDPVITSRKQKGKLKWSYLGLVDLEYVNLGLFEVWHQTLSRELSKLAKTLGLFVVNEFILDENHSLWTLRNRMATIAELVDAYNSSILKVLPSRLAIDFGISVGKALEGIESKDSGVNIANVFLNLVEIDKQSGTTDFLSTIEKRKPEDVARTRPRDPRQFERLKLLAQFFARLKAEQIRKGLDKNVGAVLDFALEILTRLKDDRELVMLGKSLRPIFVFLMPKVPQFKTLLNDPKLRQILNAGKEADDIEDLNALLQCFLPMRPALSPAKEKDFRIEYGEVVDFVEELVRDPEAKLKETDRYLVAMALQNVKTYYELGEKGKIIEMLNVIEAMLRPYKVYKDFVNVFSDLLG